MDKPQHSVQLQPFNAVANHQRYGGSQDAPLFSCDVTSLSRFTFLFSAAKAPTQANGHAPNPQPGPPHQVNKSPEEETDGFTNSQSGSFISILPSLLPSFVPFIPIFVYFLSSYFCPTFLHSCLPLIPSLLTFSFPSFVPSHLCVLCPYFCVFPLLLLSFLSVCPSFRFSFVPSFLYLLPSFLCCFLPIFVSFLSSYFCFFPSFLL